MNQKESDKAVGIPRRHFIRTIATAGTLFPLASLASSLVPDTFFKTKRPICIFSKHLQWLKIPEMARQAAALGYDGVDLTVRKGGHITPENAAVELPGAVAQIRKAGLEVPMIATDIIDPKDPLTEIILKTASQAGIKQYRTAYFKYDPALGITKSLEKYKNQLQELATLNKKYNIQGVYQNHSGTQVGAAVWDLWEILQDIDPRWMGVQYDPKHATAEGGMSWVNGMELIKNYIQCLDIKDFYWEKQGETWGHKLVPLGEGMVDFKKFFSLVKKYNISGPISIHFEYPLGGADVGNKTITIAPEQVFAALKKDLHTLRKMLQEAGLS